VGTVAIAEAPHPVLEAAVGVVADAGLAVKAAEGEIGL
jgi:hypothetical protein